MIRIRRVNHADVEMICDLLCASIRELCSPDHHDDPASVERWTANKTANEVSGWIANPRLSMFLAKRLGQPAGVGSLNDEGEILLNYVSPAHRFSGVSRAILAHLEATLVERGVNRATLTSTETAHRFYREAGWTDIGEPRRLFGLKAYPMAKELASAGDSTSLGPVQNKERQ